MVRVFIITFLFGFLLSCVGICEENPETWTSVDGRILEAKGLFWTSKVIYLKKSSDGKVVLLTYEKLDARDAIRAVSDFPFEVNESVRLDAKAVSASSGSVSVGTGKYYAVVDYYSYDNYGYSGGVSWQEETEKQRISGRSVEVKLSSVSGSGVVAVEFHVVAGKGSKKAIEFSECRVVRFEETGTKYRFSCKGIKDLKGWVIVLRSPGSGKIINSSASMHHLAKFVVSELPKKAKFKSDYSKVKAKIIAEAEGRK